MHLLWKCATVPVDRAKELKAEDMDKVKAVVMKMVVDPSM